MAIIKSRLTLVEFIIVFQFSIAMHTLIACTQGGPSFYVAVSTWLVSWNWKSIVTRIKARYAWGHSSSHANKLFPHYSANFTANYVKMKKRQNSYLRKKSRPSGKRSALLCFSYRTSVIDSRCAGEYLWELASEVCCTSCSPLIPLRVFKSLFTSSRPKSLSWSP